MEHHSLLCQLLCVIVLVLLSSAAAFVPTHQSHSLQRSLLSAGCSTPILGVLYYSGVCDILRGSVAAPQRRIRCLAIALA
jgi:Na+/H+-dicarboxylate symporter